MSLFLSIAYKKMSTAFVSFRIHFIDKIVHNSQEYLILTSQSLSKLYVWSFS